MSTERRSTPAVGNEAAERLRRLIRAGKGWPDEYLRLLDSALAAERRAVVERIWVAVEAMRRPDGDEIGYLYIGRGAWGVR